MFDFTIDLLIFCVGVIGLIIGSITDIQKREVADWISYFLIFAGLGLRLIYSVYTFEWLYFLYGLLGFGVFFALAYLMFYTGQWGGGDSKVLMGMGALFATRPQFLNDFFNPELFGLPFLVTFWINLLLVGAVYGILWTLFLGVIHFKDMKDAFVKYQKKQNIKLVRIVVFVVFVVLMISAIFINIYVIRVISLTFSFMVLGFFYLYVVIKAVEKACMYRKVTPNQLVEGDWPIGNIVVDGKVCFEKAKKLGFEIDDIDKLKKLYEKKKIKKIKIKHGIPFVPSFLFSLIISISLGNVVSFLMV